MSKYAEFEDVTLVRETALAALYLIDGEERWIPKSVIEGGDTDEDGTLRVQTWFAEKEGLV